MKKLKITWIFLAFVIFGGSIYAIAKIAPRFLAALTPKKLEANLAPDFSLLSLDGEGVRLSDLRGRDVVLNFWTSWNEAALGQLEVLNDYVDTKTDDPVILAVNSQEDAETIRDISKNFKFPLFLDSEGEVGELYDISVLPLTVFINKAGIEINRRVGPFPMDEVIKELTKL